MYAAESAEFAAPAGLAEFAEPATLAKFAAPVTLAELVAPAALANFADPDIRQDVDLLTSRVQEFANGKIPLPKGVAFQDGYISIYLKDFAPMLYPDGCTSARTFSERMDEGFLAMANGNVVPTTFLRENLERNAYFPNGRIVIDVRRRLNPDYVRDNPQALNLLAFLFIRGIFCFVLEEGVSCSEEGVSCSEEFSKEKVSAAKIFLWAAKRGDICALYNYGYCLDHGIGVEMNREEAVKIYRTIVENERALARFHGVLAQAQYRYGECLYNGDGVPENKADAAKYYRLSAKQGNALAQYSYGRCLEEIGVEENLAEAAKYYKRSADQGYYAAQYKYGECLTYRVGVGINSEDAVKYYKLAADQGYAEAQCEYGICLEHGFGVEENLAEAAKYYKLAADQGCTGIQQ
jgi:TPR repeat protein